MVAMMFFGSKHGGETALMVCVSRGLSQESEVVSNRHTYVSIYIYVYATYNII